MKRRIEAISQLIAIDPNALESLTREVERLHKRLDAVQMQPQPEWLTVKEYAVHVGRTQRTVRNWINQGQVDTKREGEVTFVRVSQAA